MCDVFGSVCAAARGTARSLTASSDMTSVRTETPERSRGADAAEPEHARTVRAALYHLWVWTHHTLLLSSRRVYIRSSSSVRSEFCARGILDPVDWIISRVIRSDRSRCLSEGFSVMFLTDYLISCKLLSWSRVWFLFINTQHTQYLLSSCCVLKKDRV